MSRLFFEWAVNVFHASNYCLCNIMRMWGEKWFVMYINYVDSVCWFFFSLLLLLFVCATRLCVHKLNNSTILKLYLWKWFVFFFNMIFHNHFPINLHSFEFDVVQCVFLIISQKALECFSALEISIIIFNFIIKLTQSYWDWCGYIIFQ